MPKFYFNLFNDVETTDEEGTELPDIDTALAKAREEALYEAAEAVREHAHLVRSHRVVVLDEAKRTVGMVTFGDVVSVRD